MIRLELTDLALHEASRLIAQRKISPFELTAAYLQRIEQFDPSLHSFITLTADTALQEARRAEVRLARRRFLGPLFGLPLTLKDLFETRNVRTTAGSPFLAEYLPQQDAAVVQKLKNAGAILLGKTQMYEWAMRAIGKNPTFGDCYNPWKPGYNPGGSSSGSAVAVAAHFCAGSLGTDSGGSVRIPAALCGVVGLKPTYGRVSTRGVLPLSRSVDHVGVLAREVRDVALLFESIAGYDPADPFSLNMPVADYHYSLTTGIRGWRIGYCARPFLHAEEVLDADIQHAFEQALQIFEEQGMSVEEVELPVGPEIRGYNGTILTVEAADYHQGRMQTHPELFSTDILESLTSGQNCSATTYAHARQLQLTLRQRFEALFNEYDLLLTPTTFAPASRFDDLAPLQPSLTACTSAWNFTGLPALSVPCGFTENGLPIGLQICGPAWAETALLRAGYLYEQATTWHMRSPVLQTSGTGGGDALMLKPLQESI